MAKKTDKKVKARHVDVMSHSALKELAHEHHRHIESDAKIYRFGFWIFFMLVLLSVGFSMLTISTLYSNFNIVTKILDESFDRTNLVMDISSGKIANCEMKLDECESIERNSNQPGDG